MSDDLSTTERLAILQSIDVHRTWRSLNDRRLCIRCTKPFSGFEIRLRPQPDGSYRAFCPTPKCDSLPQHWLFYGTDLHPGQAAEMDFASW